MFICLVICWLVRVKNNNGNVVLSVNVVVSMMVFNLMVVVVLVMMIVVRIGLV